ncbi:enoyl-[acyl-carrier-protein] reductase, mitochondrial-like [Biomphalaria glabrata]|uniref:Enoyl-[acyl-carrier-protein] reductase, mitochondrial n=1 Tax=Biomphalaria glabrata TaxID=6526 RepID=A0A9U8EBK9_BIOGL|nr:enoyl-[acyl-carrier-protein] reductase, mitochondrial-like [Biomphalaria glabrata]
MAASVFLVYCKRSRSIIIQKHAFCNIRNAVRKLSSTQLFIENFGDPASVIKLKETEVSSHLNSREVLVKMEMSPINPSDINLIEGTYFIQPPLPFILGNEGVGRVIKLGNEVKGLEIGDLVIPSDTAWGTWQSYKVTKDEDIIKLPKDIPVLSAATISVNPCTAYRILKDYVNLKPGDVVIQNGANSGVGVSVIQLAKEWKITTINIVRDRPDFEQLKDSLLAFGADIVISESVLRSSDMKKILDSLPKKPELALNCIGGNSATELIRCLSQKGTMVTYGGMSKKPIVAPTGALIFKEITLCGYWNTNWNRLHQTDIVRYEMLSDLCNLIKKSKFVPPPVEFFPLSDYKSAILKAITGFKGRKIVFKLD